MENNNQTNNYKAIKNQIIQVLNKYPAESKNIKIITAFAAVIILITGILIYLNMNQNSGTKCIKNSEYTILGVDYCRINKKKIQYEE